ncbi:MAG: Hpt domain-containing protein [Deltaproteobacteria bacterium]|nr:Hpt domain-containing protein [Deltaproteobacteria bacterium]
MTKENSKMEGEKIIVKVDADLEDLIPDYLQNREKDIESIQEAISNQDYEAIRIIGHSMKGSGSGYGFEEISNIGKDIEEGAKRKDLDLIRNSLKKLLSYLKRVEVIYEELE